MPVVFYNSSAMKLLIDKPLNSDKVDRSFYR